MNWYSVSRSSRSTGTTTPPTESSTCGIDFTLPIVRPTEAATSWSTSVWVLAGLVGACQTRPHALGSPATRTSARAMSRTSVNECGWSGLPKTRTVLPSQRGRRDPGDVARGGRDARSHVVRAAHLDGPDPARVVPPLRLGPHPGPDQGLLGRRGVRQALDHRPVDRAVGVQRGRGDQHRTRPLGGLEERRGDRRPELRPHRVRRRVDAVVERDGALGQLDEPAGVGDVGRLPAMYPRLASDLRAGAGPADQHDVLALLDQQLRRRQPDRAGPHHHVTLVHLCSSSLVVRNESTALVPRR